MGYSLENALFQWEEGRRVLQGLDSSPAERRGTERAIAVVTEGLRQRIGPTFRAAELAELYAKGTEWCVQDAMEAVPGLEADPQSLADAAFWLYLRGATDFAGGRQLLV